MRSGWLKNLPSSIHQRQPAHSNAKKQLRMHSVWL
jgi:hypothetical protein